MPTERTKQVDGAQVAVGITSAGLPFPLPLTDDGQSIKTLSSSAADNIADNISHGQISVVSTGSLIVAARADRRGVIIINTGTTIVYLGTQQVTIANGLYLAGVVGTGIFIATTAAIYGIVSSTAQTVSYMEVF